MDQIDYWLERLESQLEGTRKLLAEVRLNKINDACNTKPLH